MRVMLIISFLFFSFNLTGQDNQQYYCYNMVCVAGSEQDPEVVSPMDTEVEEEFEYREIEVNEEFSEYVKAINNPEYIRGLAWFQSAVLFQVDRPAPFFDEMPYYSPQALPLGDVEPEQTKFAPKVVIGRF